MPTHFRATNEPLFSSKANQWVANESDTSQWIRRVESPLQNNKTPNPTSDYSGWIERMDFTSPKSLITIAILLIVGGFLAGVLSEDSAAYYNENCTSLLGAVVNSDDCQTAWDEFEMFDSLGMLCCGGGILLLLVGAVQWRKARTELTTSLETKIDELETKIDEIQS